MNPLTLQYLTDFSYIIAIALFVLSLKWLSSPATARHGVLAGEIGAAMAVVTTFFNPELVQFKWILIALLVGTIVIVGALTFFPALSLGPVVEQFLMNQGRLFSLVLTVPGGVPWP